MFGESVLTTTRRVGDLEACRSSKSMFSLLQRVLKAYRGSKSPF